MASRDIILIGGSAGATAPLNEILFRLSATASRRIHRVAHTRPRHRPARGDREIGQQATGGSGAKWAADRLAKKKESDFDEALRVLEERAGLVQRIANDARQNGRPAEAQLYEPRANENRRYADIIRRAVLNSLDP